MSISITLMKNTSELNKIGKNKTNVLAASGTLKDRTSLTDPVFLIACSDTEAAKTNYIYVQDLLRYYFVRDCVSVRNGLYEFTCHVDVLESWKAQILVQRAIISRQQERWNLYLNDGQFKVFQNPHIEVFPFTHGFDSETACIALAVAGGSGS